MPLITVDALNGVPINPHDYGVNNIWYFTPATDFDAYVDSLKKNVGITYMRYPGGYESEHYNWNNNTLDTKYRNFTNNVGVSPAHLLEKMGAGNVSFVVKTEDALEANTEQEYRAEAADAARLVSTYGGQVQDWQIGNEWYNDGGAHKNYTDFLKRYATLVSYFAPAMKAAAAHNGFNIRIYVTTNWIYPDETTALKAEVGAKAWADVDGLDIHVYSGIKPTHDKFFSPLPISAVQSSIATIKGDADKELVYVSEWMADLQDNEKSGGLRNANIMMQLFGEMARSGISAAAYWAPVWPTPADHTPPAQADTITLVHDSPTFPVDADGQALGWMAANYSGASLSTQVSNSTIASIAAKHGDQLVVFVMGGSVENETVNLQVKGFSWSRIVSAQVLYANGKQVDSGPADIADIAASKIVLAGKSTAQFVINPGGPKRGSECEIVKLILQ